MIHWSSRRTGEDIQEELNGVSVGRIIHYKCEHSRAKMFTILSTAQCITAARRLHIGQNGRGLFSRGPIQEWCQGRLLGYTREDTLGKFLWFLLLMARADSCAAGFHKEDIPHTRGCWGGASRKNDSLPRQRLRQRRGQRWPTKPRLLQGPNSGQQQQPPPTASKMIISNFTSMKASPRNENEMGARFKNIGFSRSK